MAITNEQLKNRKNYIGGSDLPIIMGYSKFKTPFELALEKAGIKENNFKGNIYTEIGNVLEPLIQEKLNIKNVDEITYQYKDEENLFSMPLLGHIDGLNEEEDEVQEIKVSSGTMEDVLKQYEYQVRFYMLVTGLKKAKLHLLNRNDEDKEIIKEIQEEHGLKWDTDFEKMREIENEDTNIHSVDVLVKSDLLFHYEKKKILKKDIQSKTIKYDKDKEKIMLDRIEKFINFVEDLKLDPFFNHENEEEYKTKEKELMQKLGLIANNELIEYDFSKIEEMEKQLVAFKDIKKNYDLEKERLLKFMQDNDIKKFDNDKFVISRRAGSTRKTFDKAKYEEENGEIEQKYYKESTTKESITIKLRG